MIYKIIIEALLTYRQQLKQQELAETFKRASKDKEIIALAEREGTIDT